MKSNDKSLLLLLKHHYINAAILGTAAATTTTTICNIHTFERRNDAVVVVVAVVVILTRPNLFLSPKNAKNKICIKKSSFKMRKKNSSVKKIVNSVIRIVAI
jgi:hypothetical protein